MSQCNTLASYAANGGPDNFMLYMYVLMCVCPCVCVRVCVCLHVCMYECDGKIIKIPRREFIFRTCEDGAVWHLIPRRISSCSESILGHIGTGILGGG